VPSLAYSSMAPLGQSRGRKRRRGRREEGGASGGVGLGACEPQQSGAHRQRDDTHEPGMPFFSFVFI
jgi:hypothetical protein